MSQKFCSILVTWGTIGSSRGCKVDEPWTVKCRISRILFVCNSPDLRLWLLEHDLGFHGFYLSNFAWSSDYCIVINSAFTFCKTNVCLFVCLFELIKDKFFFVSFNFLTEWSNALRVSVPTTTSLPTTAGTFNNVWNHFSHEIYALQTSTFYQNIAKLLTHPSIILKSGALNFNLPKQTETHKKTTTVTIKI